MSRLALTGLLVASIFAGACSTATDDAGAASGEDALKQKADDEWFYGGPLPALQDASVTVSLKGHTAHVSGYVTTDVGAALAQLPHVKTKPDGARLRVDVVYPIATARPGKSNSKPGVYTFYEARPYRPDGLAFTPEEGQHQVPWGGFPFIAYNDGVAFHGPITSEPGQTQSPAVWYLSRGPVSGGCNRMMGEHVTELAHILGISMRRTYDANRSISNPSAAKVTVTAEYDTLDGKSIDVDYPTDAGVTRPAKVVGDTNVAMFGSWVGSEQPDGRDLPPDMKWEGGVTGKLYVFKEHARADMVCSVAKSDLPALRTLARTLGGELPASFCAKKQCVVDALRAATDAKATCGL